MCIFKEMSQKELFLVSPFLDKASRELHESLKDNPLEGANKYTSHNSIV